MISVFLLPFRGIIWLVLGSLFSLPWLIILLPVTSGYWLPYALSYVFEYKTQASCKIEKANINLLTGELALKNVSVFNASEFNTADCVRFKTIHCKLDFRSFLGSCPHVKELSFDCQRLSLIKQRGRNNFQTLEQLFAGCSKKNFVIDSLKFNFDGFVTVKNYDLISVRGIEFFTKKNFTFANVCRDIPLDQDLRPGAMQSMESVCNTLGTLFKNERTL